MADWNRNRIKELRENPNDYPWDDLRIPIQNTKLNPTKSEPAFEAWIDGIYAYFFDSSNADDESLHFIVQLPHSYAEGTDISPHMHWVPETSATGNVVWEFEYIVANINGVFPASATSSTITVAAGGVANKQLIASFDTITGKDRKISDVFACRLTRMSATDAADTYAGHAIALEIDFHYQMDSNGSYFKFQKLKDEYAEQKGTPKEPFKPGAW